MSVIHHHLFKLASQQRDLLTLALLDALDGYEQETRVLQRALQQTNEDLDSVLKRLQKHEPDATIRP